MHRVRSLICGQDCHQLPVMSLLHALLALSFWCAQLPCVCESVWLWQSC